MSSNYMMHDSSYLAHHGILGMKWGVRRYQNKDGSLTSAGKRRYSVDIESSKKKLKDAKKQEKQAYKAYNRNPFNSLSRTEYEKSIGATRWAEEQLKNEKVKEKINKEAKESNDRQKKYEEKYLKEGMSREEAEVAAYKRVRTEKLIAITAGVALTTVVAYVAYKHYDKNVDKIIKAGTELQNISTNGNKGVQDAFYFSMTKMDNAKYRGLYGRQLMNQGGSSIFETKIGVKKDLKVASEKTASKALEELVMKNPEYRKLLKEHIYNSRDRYYSPFQNKLMDDAWDHINRGFVDSKVYEALNLSLADHGLSTSSKVHSEFYNYLKSKGYDAIGDINDKKYSGYKSSKPMIAFNLSDKATVNKRTELGNEAIRKAGNLGVMDILVKAISPTVAGYVALDVAAGNIGNQLSKKKRDDIVRDYRKEHPNSKLSYTQILNNYYNV